MAAVFVGDAFARIDIINSEFRLIGLIHALWIAAMLSAAIGLVEWMSVDRPGVYVVQSDVETFIL